MFPVMALGCEGTVFKVDVNVNVFVNGVPADNPAIIPFPPVLVMSPVLAAVMALNCIPEIVNLSMLAVVVQVYVIVICVAELYTIVGLPEMSFPAV